MSGKARQAKLNFNIARAIGVDDMAGMLDFRKKVDDYNKAVERAQRKAQEKSGFLDFIGLAVTAAFSFLNPFGITSLIGQGGVAALAGSTARILGDGAYGNLKAPDAPTLKGTKYNKLKRQDQQLTLDDGYTQLQTDLNTIEDDIDMGHFVQPFTQALAYFGPQIIAQNSTMAEAIATEGNNISTAKEFKASLPDPGPINWLQVGLLGAGMGGAALALSGEADGMDAMPGAGEEDEEQEGDDVNWDEVYTALGFDPNQGGGMPTTPGGQAYTQRIEDLDYLEDLTDGDA